MPSAMSQKGLLRIAASSTALSGADLARSETALQRIASVLPAGWAHGARYSDEQWIGPELHR